MRIFVTGAGGYIGGAVAEVFARAGHSVSGLVRSEEKGRELLKGEVIPVVGDLARPESYQGAMAGAEVVVHCASDHSAAWAEVEGRFLDAVLSLPRALVYTAGVWNNGYTGAVVKDEATPDAPIDIVKWRAIHEKRVLEAGGVVIRPGCVYGESGSLTAFWFASAESGCVEIVGAGDNRWAMIHLHDLAQAYLLAVEKELTSTLFNIVDHSHYTVMEMAQAIATLTGIPSKVRSLSATEAVEKCGGLVPGLLIDQQLSNERARRLLNWHVRHKTFLEDLPRYYHSWKANSVAFNHHLQFKKIPVN